MRSWTIKSLLALGGVVVGLAVGGGAFWVLGRNTDNAYEDIYRRSDDPILQVELIPNANAYINADGFYGRDYALDAPPGTFRIVGLGDSISMYYSAERENHSSLLEDRLPAVVGAPVEVLNLAVAGYDAPQQVRSLVVRGLKYDPDLVMVSHCINDSVDLRGLLENVAGVSPDEVHPLSAEAEQRIRAAGGPRWDVLFQEHIEPSDRWRESLAAYEELADLASQHGFQVVLVLFPTLVDLDDYHLAPVHRALAAHGIAQGFDVVDLWPSFRPADLEGLRSGESDVVHLGPPAYIIAAAEIQRTLQRTRPWEQAAVR